MPVSNPGYDIRSATPNGNLIHVEVKGRLSGATDFFVTYNEVLLGKNTAPNYRLALVDVSPDGQERDQILYLADRSLGSASATSQPRESPASGRLSGHAGPHRSERRSSF